MREFKIKNSGGQAKGQIQKSSGNNNLTVVYLGGLGSHTTKGHKLFDFLTDNLVPNADVIRLDYIGCGINKDGKETFWENHTTQLACQHIADTIRLIAKPGIIRFVGRSMGVMAVSKFLYGVAQNQYSSLTDMGFVFDKVAIHAGAGRIRKTIEYLFARDIFYKELGYKVPYDFMDSSWYLHDKINALPRRNNNSNLTRREMILQKLDKMWIEICQRPGQEVPFSFFDEHQNYAAMFRWSNLRGENILWIHGDRDDIVPFPMSGWSDIYQMPKDNFILVKGGTHELNTPEEMSQYMDRLVQFLIS